MQKLIVVEGAKGSGKTSAIHLAAELLGCGLTDNKPADIFMITKLKFSARIRSIGIASSGDSKRIIEDNMNALCLHDLNYIITACSAPRYGMPFLQMLAESKRAKLISIISPWERNATPEEISKKIANIAQQIRDEIP